MNYLLLFVLIVFGIFKAMFLNYYDRFSKVTKPKVVNYNLIYYALHTLVSCVIVYNTFYIEISYFIPISYIFFLILGVIFTILSKDEDKFPSIVDWIVTFDLISTFLLTMCFYYAFNII